MRTVLFIVLLFIVSCSCGEVRKRGNAPVVTGITNTDTSGGTVTILGQNFGSDASEIVVFIDGKACNVTSVSGQNKTFCTIGPGTGTAKSVILSVAGVQTLEDNVNFNYNAPAVNSATSVYSVGGVVTVVGNNFGSSASVISSLTIGGLPCTSPTLIQDQTTITCTLGAGGSGKNLPVIVTVGGQESGSNTAFSYLDATCATPCGANAVCVAPNTCQCDKGYNGDGQTCTSQTDPTTGNNNPINGNSSSGSTAGSTTTTNSTVVPPATNTNTNPDGTESNANGGGNGNANSNGNTNDGGNGNGGGLNTDTNTNTNTDGASANGALNIPSHNKSNTGKIVGAVVGSVVGLILVVLLALFLYKRRNRNPPTPEFVVGAGKSGKVFGLDRLGTGWEQQEARRIANQQGDAAV